MPAPIAAKQKSATTVALHERIRTLAAHRQDSEDILAARWRGECGAMMVAQSETNDRHVPVGADQPHRAFIAQVHEGAMTLRQDGTMLFGNQRLAALLGVPLERLAGHALQTFVAAEDAAVLAQLFEQARIDPARGEITLRGAGGRQMPAQLSLGFLHRDDDQIVLLGILTDLTELHARYREMADSNARVRAEILDSQPVEDAPEHARKLEAIGSLAAGVAHDFNNILQSIVGCLELVEDEFPPGSPRRRFVDMALHAAVRGSSITHQLLSYARRQILLPRTVAVVPFLAGMQEMLTRTLGPAFTVEMPTQQVPAIVVDPDQLQTALLHLAINASHAMPQGGTVSIQARVESTDAAPWVVIAVTDTGIGMDAATLARATEPFFTTKGMNGSGLGLSMVHGFAAQSGGRFVMTSAPGAGTTVEMRLPMAVSSDR